MWWCAFDQGEMDYAPYRWNTIGSDYGFFTRQRQEKPVATENRKFSQLLQQLPGGCLPPHQTDACVLVPRETPETARQLNGILRSTYLLSKQANLDVRFAYALDSIPDAKLYIFTGLTHHKTITKQRLDELLEKVRAGAVLYMSLDSGLFRQLPEIAGVEIESRHQVNKNVTLQLGDDKLPVLTQYFYTPESYTAEPLAFCDTGEPVFFRHRLGNGWVYLLTLPLERHLAALHGAFFEEGVAPYHQVYRELAKAAGICRLCDSDHPYVRLTEHPIDENSRYVFAINYSAKPATVPLSIQEGYAIRETLYGSPAQDGVLSIPANDGVLCIVHK